jgi:hypothetical protein
LPKNSGQRNKTAARQWAHEEGMIAADIAKDFERYGGKTARRGVLTVEEAEALFKALASSNIFARSSFIPLPLPALC